MSTYSGAYSDGAPSKRSSRRSRRPVYEERIIESKQGRNQPPLQQALVRRPRSDSSSSIEEIDRAFDAENGTYTQRRTVVRDRYGDTYGAPRPRSDGGYDASDRGRRSRRHRSRDSSDSYADTEPSRSRSRERRHRSKSRGEKALEAIGLGGAAGAIAKRVRSMSRGARGRRDSRESSADSYYEYRSKSQGPGRARSSSRRRGDSRSPTRKQKVEDAAKAALAAAAIEAWRARKEVPGEAGKRIITAALASAGIDAAVQREKRHGNRNALVSALGGLATNRLINGQGRSRSRPRRGSNRDDGNAGTLASVAALAAIAGKAIKDQRDRSRSKPRSRTVRSNGSDDDRSLSRSRSRSGSRSPDRRRRKSLSEHLYKPADAVLAKMGFGESEHHKPQYYKDRHGRRHYSDDDDDDGPRLRGGGGDDDDSGSDSDCSTDSYSSDEEEKKIKSGRTKSLITGGLAAVATIHAAHSVYNSMEAREARHRKVMQGKMTPEEARRLKSRAALQDVAAVGIAALGIKGAVSEWKEVREHRHSITSRRQRLEEMRDHRQKKKEKGEWDEDVWQRKREKHFGKDSERCKSRTRSESRPDSRSRASSQSRPSKTIGYYDDDRRDRDRDRDRDRGSRRRGRSAGRYSDDFDDRYDDDPYNNARLARRGHRTSLPPAPLRESRYYEERYDDPARAAGSSSSRFADDGPRYADGNPFGGGGGQAPFGGVRATTTMPNLPLSSQLPPPPVGLRNAAPRY